MKIKLLLILLIFTGLMSFVAHKDLLFFAPKKWPKPVYNFTNNSLDKTKIKLGRILFYDPILSKNNTISCANCHSPYNAFTHVDHALSHGIGDSIGIRNSPALMNLAWHKSFMWDGAVNHLDMQALSPISHLDEMGETIENVVLKLQQSNGYKRLFYKAYGDSLATGERVLKSISQFMLTLVSSNSKYDSVINMKASFSIQEKKGYTIFLKNCSSCHTEPLFTNLNFENNGLSLDKDLKDYGRIKVTQSAKDSLKFKVPTLRNIEFTYPYMHDGRFKTIGEVLNHYTDGIIHYKTLSQLLQKKIKLNADEKVDLTTFLLTLTDKSFLFNPKFGYLNCRQ